MEKVTLFRNKITRLGRISKSISFVPFILYWFIVKRYQFIPLSPTDKLVVYTHLPKCLTFFLTILQNGSSLYLAEISFSISWNVNSSAFITWGQKISQVSISSWLPFIDLQVSIMPRSKEVKARRWSKEEYELEFDPDRWALDKLLNISEFHFHICKMRTIKSTL